MKRLMERQYVYVFAQRVLHWWLALSTFMLMVTGFIASRQDPDGDRAFMWTLHMFCGQLLAMGLAGRLLWLILGPEHARFSALFHPKVWLESVKTRKMLSADSAFGHHEQASGSYIMYYALILGMTFTGFALAGMIHGEGPLAESLLDEFKFQGITREIHEWGWYITAGFVVTHIAAMIFHEYRDQIPISQSMFSGFQYRTSKEDSSEKK